MFAISSRRTPDVKQMSHPS